MHRNTYWPDANILYMHWPCGLAPWCSPLFTASQGHAVCLTTRPCYPRVSKFWNHVALASSGSPRRWLIDGALAKDFSSSSLLNLSALNSQWSLVNCLMMYGARCFSWKAREMSAELMCVRCRCKRKKMYWNKVWKGLETFSRVFHSSSFTACNIAHLMIWSLL